MSAIGSYFPGTSLCDIWVFDENNQIWSHDYAVGTTTNCYGNNITFSAADVISGGDGIMDVGRGYFVPGATTNNRKCIGQVNNGDLSIPVSTTSIGNNLNWDNDDWNLLGNPYPSSLDADAFIQENAINNNHIDGAIYFWDGGDTANGYNQHSDYATYNLLGGVNSGNSSILPAGHIGSGQGFWVYATNNSNVVFNNSMRSNSNNQYFKTTNSDANHLTWFSLTTPSSYKNNILIGYNNQTTDSIDRGYDAHKLVGNDHVRFASKMGRDEFVIQAVAPILVGDRKTIPLVLYSDETGIHTFSAYQKENMPSNLKVYLRDKILGVEHDLTQGDYNVSLVANQTYDSRFELLFQHHIVVADNDKGTKGNNGSNHDDDNLVLTSIETLKMNEFSLIQDENQVAINCNSEFTGTIQLRDISGKLVATTKLNMGETTTSISWSNFAAGTYIISIVNDKETVFASKVIKQ